MPSASALSALHFFKALADETRLAIVLLLHRQGELCVCDLIDALQLSQPKISRHLALLRRAGLLGARRQQQWMYYTLDASLPDWSRNILDNLLSANQYPAGLQAFSVRPDQRSPCLPRKPA